MYKKTQALSTVRNLMINILCSELIVFLQLKVPVVIVMCGYCMYKPHASTFVEISGMKYFKID
jgi:hypothetical protein